MKARVPPCRRSRSEDEGQGFYYLTGLTTCLTTMPAPDWELPHFILISPVRADSGSTPNIREESLVKEWRRAITTLPSNLQTHFTVLEGTLSSLPPDKLRCDCVVSPANSFGIMDGG